MTTRPNEKIIVLNNTLLEVPEPEVSCKFLTARTPLIWELLASRNTEESVERNKEKSFSGPTRTVLVYGSQQSQVVSLACYVKFNHR